jgi:hypothetical protein
MGEFLKSFKSRADYESGKTGTYPSISFIEGDNTVEYEKRSFITATYEISDSIISKYPDEIPLIRDTKLRGYSIEGEYSEKFTKIEKTVNLEFTQVISDNELGSITVIPNEEFFITSEGMNENFQLTLSRELNESDWMFLTMIPSESTEYISDTVSAVELIQGGQITVSEDGLTVTISEELISSLKEDISNNTADGRVAIFIASEADVLNYPNGITDLNVSLRAVDFSCPDEITYPTPSSEKVIKVIYELDPQETSVGNYDELPLKTIEFNLLKDKEYHVVDDAFRNTKLNQVEFPDQIVKLGKYIFGGESGTSLAAINTLSLGDKITNTDEAFVGPYPTYLRMGKGMTNVTALSIPNACVDIKFSDNTERIETLSNPRLRRIIIPKSVKYFGGISGEQLKTIIFDGCNPEIPENGFIGNCPQLNSVSLGKNWSQPLHNVLHNNLPMLKSFTIPPLVTEIPEDFCRDISSGKGSLQTLYIGRGVKNIHYKAFDEFGDSLTEIYCLCKKPPHVDGYYEMNGITTVGTLYCPKGTLDEWNSSDNHLGALLKKRGWTIQEMPDEETVENNLEETGNEE